MAAYQKGFDPPNRPGDRNGSRIPGAYAQPGPSNRRPEYRETGVPDSRRAQPVAGRAQQHHLALPRSSTREPSSDRGHLPEPTASRAGTATRFGFGKSNRKGSSDSEAPELRSKPSRNVLRRKPSLIAQHSEDTRSTMERSGSTSPTKWSPAPTEQRPSIEASMRSMEAYNDIFTRTNAKSPAIRNSPRIIPELDRYGTRPETLAGQRNKYHTDVPKLATQDLPPPTPSLSAGPGASGYSGGSGGSGGSGASWTPMYPAMNNNHNRYSGYSGSGYSASPSTRFSESPGPSAYSRDTTPTSMASQSPGILAPSKTTTPRLRQGPPVTRRRTGSPSPDADGLAIDTHSLPALQESVTSSSSNSTVKGGAASKNSEPTEKKKKKKGLSPLAPSPPPRKSSQKSTEPSPTKRRSPPKTPKDTAQAVVTSPKEDFTLEPPNVFSHRRNTSSSSTVGNAPIRPSRDGIPNLQSQLGGSIPIIQSNLAGLSSVQDKPGRRQSLVSLNNVASQKQSPYQSQSASRFNSRNPSPAPEQFSPHEAAISPSGLGIIPDLRPVQTHPTTSSTRAPSPTVANSKQRFGLFSRRTKTAPAELPNHNTKDKAHRKGPAAGTGHEGYGKYGARGRTNLAGGIDANRNRSTSVASSAESVASSTRTHDPFLLDRMSPVIIAGGGGILENRNANAGLTRTESDTSLVLGVPSLASKSSSSLGQEGLRTTLWPSALPKEPSKRVSTIGSKGRRPSDSSDDWTNQRLAFRRSIQRYNSSTSALSLPKPPNMSSMGVSPSLRSLESSLMESSIMSDDSQMGANAGRGRGRKVQKAMPKKLEKRPKSPRKWNFFHRSQPKGDAQVGEVLPVTVGRPPIKAVPHYAMLDSSDEQQDPEQVDLGEILRDAQMTHLTNEELDVLQFNNYKENLRRIEELQVQMDAQAPMSLPERSPIIFSSPEPLHSTPELTHSQPRISNETTPPSAPADETGLHLTADAAPVRPSRLPQVGRIPKVMSARPETTSPKSFSRPFARLSALQPIQGPITIDQESIALGADPLETSALESLAAAAQTEDPRLRKDSKGSTSDSTHFKQFLTFSPRKNSEATSSSGTTSFAGTVAVIPEANAALEVDEVWDEYDDLIENTDVVKSPVSATSSRGMPFQYENYESRKMSQSETEPKKSPKLQQTPPAKGLLAENSTTKDLSADDPFRSSQITTSSMHSVDMATRMKALLVTVPSPKATTSPRFRDESAKKHGRPSQGVSTKASVGSPTGSGPGLVAIKEPENSSPISQVNLRVGSMTVSKWLTFGHVLFSPARERIMKLEGPTNTHSILVIDGLGNGMFFCLLNTPSL
jgi:hypothetical protein